MNEVNENKDSNLIYYQIQQMKIKDLISLCKKENAKIASLEDIANLRVLENQTSCFRINKKREIFMEDSILDYGPYLTRDYLLLIKEDNRVLAKVLTEQNPFLFKTKSFYIPNIGVEIIEGYNLNKCPYDLKVNYKELEEKCLNYPLERFEGDNGKKIDINLVFSDTFLKYLLGNGDEEFLKCYQKLLQNSGVNYFKVIPERVEGIDNKLKLKALFYTKIPESKSIFIFSEEIDPNKEYLSIILKDGK
jgi:hypothetical protein